MLSNKHKASKNLHSEPMFTLFMRPLNPFSLESPTQHAQNRNFVVPNKSVLTMNTSAWQEDMPLSFSEDLSPCVLSPVLKISSCLDRLAPMPGLFTMPTTTSGSRAKSISSCLSSTASTENYSPWKSPTSRPIGLRIPKLESAI